MVTLAPQQLAILVLALAAAGTLILIAVFTLLLMRYWLPALLAGAPVALVALLGMWLRRSNVEMILNARIMAAQHGLDAPVLELERACLAGANLEKLVLAAADLQDRGEAINWQQLVKAQRPGRLAELQNI